MATSLDTTTQSEDVSRKLLLFLEKEWAESVQDSGILLKELLEKYPTSEVLKNEWTKIDDDKGKKEKERKDLEELKKWLEGKSFSVPKELNDQIDVLIQAIGLLT